MATRRSFDDSDEEEEATAIDLRSNSEGFKKATAQLKPSQPSSPPASSIAAKKPPAPLHESELSGDEEATEFLNQRPSSIRSALPGDAPSSQMRARGRAVPLEGGEEKRDTTEPVPAPHAQEVPAAAAQNLPNRTPRPLPERIISDLNEGNTATGSSGGGTGKSQPRITRIFVDPSEAASGTLKKFNPIGDDDAASETDPGSDATDPPAPMRNLPRPLPAAGKPPTIVASAGALPQQAPGRAKTARTPSQPTSETLEAEPADGTLIVEVPDGAVVFVDGLERGKGPSLKVKEIDRYAKHAVRIHAPGFLPWSGSVCLEGRTAAKIRPSLKKRDK